MKVAEISKAFLPLGGFYLKFPIEILLGGGGVTPLGHDIPELKTHLWLLLFQNLQISIDKVGQLFR